MANLVAYLNARPISTRFHIRVATVRAVQVMRETTGINLPAGARRASTLNWHTDSLRLFDGRVYRARWAGRLLGRSPHLRSSPTEHTER
jgi:hypothetical protein